MKRTSFVLRSSLMLLVCLGTFAARGRCQPPGMTVRIAAKSATICEKTFASHPLQSASERFARSGQAGEK